MIHGTVAPTDFGWWEFLAGRSEHEVNFWTPSAKRRFKAPEFSPFFFKLKSPHNSIAGFGYFTRWTHLPEWLAWECFGSGNGCRSLTKLRERIAKIRAGIGYVPGDTSDIGCILLTEPTFFPRDMWIPQPRDWQNPIVSGKQYDLSTGEGLRIWEQCRERATELSAHRPSGSLVFEGPTGPRFGTSRPVAPRLGQGAFRIAVTDAYDRACAVTAEHSLPALEAAHIRAFSADGPNEVRNGILLRADLHRLFDIGYVTVTPEHRLEVSPRLREDYSNGRSYYPLHGAVLHVPKSHRDRPDASFLTWHNERVFRP